MRDRLSQPYVSRLGKSLSLGWETLPPLKGAGRGEKVRTLCPDLLPPILWPRIGLQITRTKCPRYLRGQRKQSGQSVHLKTAETLAKEHGVNEKTIRRDGKRADQRSIMRGRRYNRTKKAAHDGGKGRPRVDAEVAPTNTAATIAKQHGVSERTIRRDGKRAEAIEKLAGILAQWRWHGVGLVGTETERGASLVVLARCWFRGPHTRQS